MTTATVNKNMILMLGAAEICCKTLRREGFKSDYQTLTNRAGRMALVVVGSLSQASITRFLAADNIDGTAIRGLSVWLWIYEDMTVYTVGPEVIGKRQAEPMRKLLEQLAKGMADLVPNFPNPVEAKLSQARLRGAFQAIEPNLMAFPKVSVRPGQELN